MSINFKYFLFYRHERQILIVWYDLFAQTLSSLPIKLYLLFKYWSQYIYIVRHDYVKVGYVFSLFHLVVLIKQKKITII